MNKKKTLILLLTASFFLSLPKVSFAGPFDFLNNASKASNIDLKGLSSKGTKLISTVSKANNAFADAAVGMLNSLGMKEKAEKLKAVQEEVKKKSDDPENVKKLVKATNEAMDDLNKADLKSQVNLKKSQKELVNASLKFGGGSALDLKAVDSAKSLGEEAVGLLDQVKSNPMDGLSALGTINSIVDSSKFIVENVPNQVNSVQTFSQKLFEYFKANKIEAPSVAKIKEYSDQLSKE